MELPKNKKIYFASDNHLGLPDEKESREREKFFVTWLEDIRKDAAAIYLLGDLFDFWFEYKTVVPKGFVRVLGKLAELSDAGIPITFFVGNHDLWMRDYFQKELGVTVHHHPITLTVGASRFFIGHGDGLGPGDKGYKRMKKLFTNPISKWLFRWLHPDWGVRLGQYLSRKNKLISGEEDVKFLGEDKEWLVAYSKKKLQEEHFDYFVFGHRHLPLEINLSEKSQYINLGDWITHNTYAEYDGKHLILKNWKK
ncbi:UDP-2,3-diacylglucosamine diphosphatase [Flavobacteriaceae bacterium]|nr:UDP-2,3-diacylglucosamine diphosphatase [Flavobacteriaceae bacterium]MDC0478674.1 UDP-2,3-diacylglucosamine diphosphatase [Flavobacteriaceae bacterium]